MSLTTLVALSLSWHISWKLASFPGSPTLEHQHWSCAGGESLVFFLTWAASRLERGYRDLNFAWAYPKTQNRKKSNHSSHVSTGSYWGVNIIHTEHWTQSWWLNNAQNFAFLFYKFCSYFNYIILTWEKVPGSVYMFTFQSREAWEWGYLPCRVKLIAVLVPMFILCEYMCMSTLCYTHHCQATTQDLSLAPKTITTVICSHAYVLGYLTPYINSERSEAIPGFNWDFSSSPSSLMVNRRLALKLWYLKNGARDHHQTGRHECSSCY